MSRRFTGATSTLLLCCAGAFAQPPQPRGLQARAKPSDYPAHVSINGVTYAASLVPSVEVKHLFAFDISTSYVVFEVAVYPAAPTEIDPDGFLVRRSSKGDPARPSDPVTVASVIQQKNLPPLPSRKGSVVGSTAVGYESGRDPVTGQRVHGTYTASEVAVNSPDNAPPRPPAPGGYPQDRELLESQLWDKSLPGGQLRQSTAGYLYFPSSLLKKKKDGAYQLEYLGSEQKPILNGSAATQGIQLQVLATRH